MALTAAHFLPNNILFSFCFSFLLSLINFANVAVFCSRLNFLFFCCCFTSFNLGFYFTGESCGSLRVFLNFVFVLRLFRHILHMRCRVDVCWMLIVWICFVCLSRVFCTCTTSSPCAVIVSPSLLSRLPLNSRSRFIIKHFSFHRL